MLSNKKRRGIVADINVTPLIDVMLVLVATLMVAIPTVTFLIPLDLPTSHSNNKQQAQTQQLVISFNKQGELFLMKEKLTMDILLAKLHALTTHNKLRILLRADKDMPYGLVVKLIAQLSREGFTQIGLVTQVG